MVERRLVDRVVVGEVDERLLDGAFAEDEDEAGHPLVDGDEVDPADVGGARLRGVARPADRVMLASVVAARRNQCSLANSTWPNWCRIMSCSTAGSGTASTIDST